jgi:hypothetical protein
MSTTSIRPNLSQRDGRRDGRAGRRSMALATRVALQRHALTRELAAGTPPALSPELSARAAQLVTPHHRREAARAWRRTLREARQLRIGRRYFSIIRRSAVIDAEQAIDALISRLNDTRPVAVQGMAMLDQLTTDGAESPLYCAAEAGSLQRQVMLAIEAMSPEHADRPRSQV